MNDPITLSIIVPVYNIEAFLPESLDSLAKIQFDAPYEVIVIDDGSSDGSLAILRVWEETHNQLRVITGPNGGGKSTLAKLIAGIEKPTAGRIFFNGEDITELGIVISVK